MTGKFQIYRQEKILAETLGGRSFLFTQLSGSGHNMDYNSSQIGLSTVH